MEIIYSAACTLQFLFLLNHEFNPLLQMQIIDSTYRLEKSEISILVLSSFSSFALNSMGEEVEENKSSLLHRGIFQPTDILEMYFI